VGKLIFIAGLLIVVLLCAGLEGFGVIVGLIGGLVGLVVGIIGAVIGVIVGILGAIVGVAASLCVLAAPLLVAILITAGIFRLLREV
jgi:hypothetical protein